MHEYIKAVKWYTTYQLCFQSLELRNALKMASTPAKKILIDLSHTCDHTSNPTSATFCLHKLGVEGSKGVVLCQQLSQINKKSMDTDIA
jgi:hypothetical protein